ncbi:MAG: hypothetical protein MHM6MM_002716 [Cercozoa sp. M6MM]
MDEPLSGASFAMYGVSLLAATGTATLPQRTQRMHVLGSAACGALYGAVCGTIHYGASFDIADRDQRVRNVSRLWKFVHWGSGLFAFGAMLALKQGTPELLVRRTCYISLILPFLSLGGSLLVASTGALCRWLRSISDHEIHDDGRSNH